MIRSLALTLLLTPLALQAQKPSLPVSTHILTIAPASLPDAFQTYYRTARNIEPFTASVGSFGFPTPYTGTREFALYGTKADLDPPAKGATPNPPVATVILPEESALVLIICTNSADDKISLAAHNVDSRDLKSGDYRVFNFSKSQVAMTTGDQSFELAPGKDSIIRDPKWHDKPIALPITIATVVDGKPNPVYSSFLEHFPKNRNLLFLFDGSDPNEPITFVTLDADKAAPQPDAGKRPSNRRKP